MPAHRTREFLQSCEAAGNWRAFVAATSLGLWHPWHRILNNPVMNPRLSLLVIAILVSSAGQAAAYYQSRNCNVGITGSDWLFKHTDILASLTDSNGGYSTRPNHLSVQNRSSKPCWFDYVVSAYYVRPGESYIVPEKVVVQNAGPTWDQDHGYKVEPNGTLLIPLPAVYRKPDDPLQMIQVNFVYWVGEKKTSPTPTPAPAATPGLPPTVGDAPPNNASFGTPKTGWLIEHDDQNDKLLFGMKEWFFFNADGSLLRARLGERGWYDCTAGSSFTWRKEGDKVFVAKDGGSGWSVKVKGNRIHTFGESGEFSYSAQRLDTSPLR